MEQDEIVEMFEKTGALLTGHFELRSGLHSDQYFQCANVLAFPHMARKLCRELVSNVTVAMTDDLDPDGVIAPALGGIVVGHEVAAELGVKSIFVEKNEGTLILRRFKIEADEHYVVAEDVITRGGRVQETIDIVREMGGKVDAVAVLVDRSAGGVDFGVPTFSLVQMAPLVYEPSKCPLCAEAIPLLHPGS